MPRRLALLALVIVMLVGCDRYRSRAQGPFPRPPASNPGKSPLALNAPTPPLPPGTPDDLQLVPPRPPEPGPLGYAVSPHPAADAARLDVQPTEPPAKTAPQPSPQATNLAAVKKLAQAAVEKAKALDTYEARFVRREMINDAQGPTEEVIFRFKSEPMAVYMKSVGEVGKGREVLYNPSKFGDKIHVIVGEGDTRLLKPGTKGPSLSPDNPQIRAKSRHSIRESGIGISAGKFVAAVAKIEAGKVPAETIKYAGAVKREEFGNHPLEGVELTIRKGTDEGLPGGGVQHWFFDAKADSPSCGLPVLVILYDANNKEVEYYRYTHFKSPANLMDADFDPAKMGKK